VIDFSTTTAFRLVRRLAMGQGISAMYLLIYEEGTELLIETDLCAEVDVQLSIPLPIGRVSELIEVDALLGLPDSGPIRVLRIDRWSPELVTLLDTHVIRLEQTGAQFLFLTTPALAEQLLIQAPNFRNRLTDVLRVIPDDPSGGGPL
jgi:hypothetical protein